MSILTVFGQNLRNLTQLRGTHAHVAAELDIGRVQFQRYLRSESFPKPDSLEKICTYFDVDARILTDLLTIEQLEEIKSGRPNTEITGYGSAMSDAMAYCGPDQDYFSDSNALPDGIYQLWRGTVFRPDSAFHMLTKIETVDSARNFKGIIPKSASMTPIPVSPRYRTMRGPVLRHRLGFAIPCFDTTPGRQLWMLSLNPIAYRFTAAAYGITVLARNETPGLNRVVRCFMFKIDSGYQDILKLARHDPFVKWEDVPPDILNFIRPRDESF